MYLVREVAHKFTAAVTGDFVAFEPVSGWLVVNDDHVGQPDAVALCWSESDADSIASALNGS